MMVARMVGYERKPVLCGRPNEFASVYKQQFYIYVLYVHNNTAHGARRHMVLSGSVCCAVATIIAFRQLHINLMHGVCYNVACAAIVIAESTHR